jgi:hypothetical protein
MSLTITCWTDYLLEIVKINAKIAVEYASEKLKNNGAFLRAVDEIIKQQDTP